MSSFYGNYGGSGGGSISDYNELLNKPIKILVGTDISPVVLNNLEYGEYLVKGSYVYTNKDTNIKKPSYQYYISIFEDVITKRKIAKFETVEDSIYYIYTITFKEDDTCLEDKLSIQKSQGIIFVGEQNLPSQGTESILYVTEEHIYQWKNEEYVSMNEPQWGSF